ncbi:MAG: flagellar basal body P-ring formation protein FlgA, partial [Planctomycetales bacterium]|nr:flagellar basal body P-ring formation protein FlgA [Planctomycetales bacterium]
MTTTPRLACSLACLAFAATCLASTARAESGDANYYIQLRPSAHIDDALVYASDVAELTTDDRTVYEAFAQIRLFARPAVGDRRLMSRQEFAELLAFRGLDPRRLHVEGATACMVAASQEFPTAPLEVHGPTSAAVDNNRELERLIRMQLGESERWDVELIALLGSTQEDRPKELLTPVEANSEIQTLRVRLADGEIRSSRIRLHRNEIAPVLRRDVRRGERIVASDVVMEEISGVEVGDVVFNADDLVGMEATTNLMAGLPVPVSSVRRPFVVRRRQIAEITVRRGGVAVRTTARPLEDGAVGDVVSVQSLEGGGESYFAVVVGPNQLEVLGG